MSEQQTETRENPKLSEEEVSDPVKQVRAVQRRTVEGARDREFRPVRPPLAPKPQQHN